MNFEQVLVTAIFLATTVALVASKKRPSQIFSTCILALVVCQQVSLTDVVTNLANPGVITLVLLILISQAIDKTAFIKKFGRQLITATHKGSYARLFGFTFVSSALLNNTAIVASLIGPIKQNPLHAPSRLLIPLSYSAILGGTVTLIGTSTNLIVNSFLLERGQPGFSFFEFTLYGLSAGLACGLLMLLLSPLLPDRQSHPHTFKRYLIEARVQPGSELVGNSVEQNHLRNLPELFLVEIVRDKQVIAPVTPDMLIQAGDVLIFSGNVQKVDSLNHIQGLTLFAEHDGLLGENLTEVIIANRASILGQTLKSAGFRALFDAAVVAIRRDGENLSGKLGEIKLQAGDYLLLATGPDFVSRHNIAKNFFVLSEQKLPKRLSPFQEYFTLFGFVASISAAAFSIIPLPTALLMLLALLVITGVSDKSELKRQLPINLVLVVVGALSLANALQTSGLIHMLTQQLHPLLSGTSIFVALLVVYLATLVLTELVTNNAAAALMFPFAYGLVEALQAPLMPFALAVAFAASASFISPYGYQTNLLVFNATHYRFSDFVKQGLPLSLCYSIIVLALLKWQYQL